jgi:hypothetical protein
MALRRKSRKTMFGQFKSAITGRFLSHASAARWPKSSYRLKRR